MSDVGTISINLTSDDLVRLIETTAAARQAGRQAVQASAVNQPPQPGGQQVAPSPVQPLWCGILACGGSVNI